MHVGLNLIFLVPGQTGGMEIYARELAPRLAALEGLRITAFVNEEAAGEEFGAGVQRVVVPVRASNRAQWVRGEQLLLPRLAAAHGIDLLHSLGSTAPLHGPFRRVVTIHDLLYKLVPDAHFGLRGLGMRVLVPSAARSSHRIIVDAASTREDLVTHLRVPRGKVDVIPLAGASPTDVVPTPEPELRRKYDLADRQVLLTVSAKRPHKNLLRLIEAFALLPTPRPILVLPGYPTPHEAELRTRATSLGVLSDLRFPAWVDTADLEALYTVAIAFVFPSLYEGFGLPVLEAMARGLPVATSNRGSLAEVAAEAALLFDPESVAGIAAAMGRLLTDAGLRMQLSTAGRRRDEDYSWELVAGAARASYFRCSNG